MPLQSEMAHQDQTGAQARDDIPGPVSVVPTASTTPCMIHNHPTLDEGGAGVKATTESSYSGMRKKIMVCQHLPHLQKIPFSPFLKLLN